MTSAAEPPGWAADAARAPLRAVPAWAPGTVRLLAGPSPDRGAETYAEHRSRLGRRPSGGEWMVDVLERSGLRGRGGAWFPTARRWAEIRRRPRGPAVVVVNLSEGEPLSAKDRALALHRPHLVLDGAQIAAETVEADEILICLAGPGRAVPGALRHALAERGRAVRGEVPVALVRTRHRYVAGESSAVVRRANGGPARPASAPPHPSQSGVRGEPTLVQNAETLAHVALIARFGPAWYRERGTPGAPGTTLLTLSGGVEHPGVYEVGLWTPLLDVVRAAGTSPASLAGALVGGYFGTWQGREALVGARLSPDEVSLGCGVLGILDGSACGLVEAARVAAYLARESAGQCGPCLHGLRAVAEVMGRIAASDADPGDLGRLRRWSHMIPGRGACHHPDGAVGNAVSALTAFAPHLVLHLRGIPCSGRGRSGLPPPPRPGWW